MADTVTETVTKTVIETVTVTEMGKDNQLFCTIRHNKGNIVVIDIKEPVTRIH